MNGLAPRSVITGVPGWETVNEQYTLDWYARRVPERGVIVEIGAEFGMSASIFCRAARPDVEIFSIDLFPGDLQRLHLENLTEAGFAQHLPAGFVSRSTQFAGDSATIGKDWRNWTINRGRNGYNIDLLFIDGDHSYNGVVRDIEAWLMYMKPGGVVIFHDAAPPTNVTPHPDGIHHDVQRAIDDTLNMSVWTEQPSVDTMRIFINNL